MKLFADFVKEIKKVTDNDGTRLSKISVKDRIRSCAYDMSVPSVIDDFNAMIIKHGRAVVAICVAQKVLEETDRHDYRLVQWSAEVIAACKMPLGDAGVYSDGLHPSRVDAYSASLVKHTIDIM